MPVQYTVLEYAVRFYGVACLNIKFFGGVLSNKLFYPPLTNIFSVLFIKKTKDRKP